MLKFALPFKEELHDLFSETCDNPKYRFYHLGYFSLPEIENDEWNKICRVSCTDHIIGYMTAGVNRNHGIVDNVSLISFANNFVEYKLFEIDILFFLLLLLQKFPTIQWNVVYDNPVRKRYEKFVNHIGGNIVGIQHNCIKINKELKDRELFEIVHSENTVNKIKSLIQRFL